MAGRKNVSKSKKSTPTQRTRGSAAAGFSGKRKDTKVEAVEGKGEPELAGPDSLVPVDLSPPPEVIDISDESLGSRASAASEADANQRGGVEDEIHGRLSDFMGENDEYQKVSKAVSSLSSSPLGGNLVFGENNPKQETTKTNKEPSKLLPSTMAVSCGLETKTDLVNLLACNKSQKRKLPTSQKPHIDSPQKSIKMESVVSLPTRPATESKPRIDAPDVVLVSGNERKPACSAHLIYHSNFFRHKLSSLPSREGVMKKIDVSLANPSMLGVLVRKIKSTEPDVSFDEAKQLLQIAIQLDMNILKEKCMHAIMDVLTGENWLQLKILAIDAGSVDLNRFLDSALESKSKVFMTTIVKSKQFAGLSLHTISKLLAKKNFCVTDKLVHELTEGWLNYESRRDNWCIFSQIKALELLRADDYNSTSIFDGKTDMELPKLDTETPGWVFLQSLVTPKQLAASCKSLDISLNHLLKVETSTSKGNLPVEAKVRARKRIAEVLEQETETKRRNTVAITKSDFTTNSFPRIPKLNRAASNDETKSWDPMGNSAVATGKSGHGEEMPPRGRNSGTRNSKVGRGQEHGKQHNDDEDWGSGPVKEEANADDNWDAASSRSVTGKQSAVDDDWGISAPLKNFNDRSSSFQGVFGNSRGRRANDGVPDGESTWTVAAKPWKAKSRIDEFAPDASCNTSKKGGGNGNDTDWGTPRENTNNSSSSDADWGNPPVSVPSYGSSRRDSGSSWTSTRRDNGGLENRRGGRGGRGGSRDRGDTWACSSCPFAHNFSSRDTCFKCSARKPEHLQYFGSEGRGEGRGGRGGRGRGNYCGDRGGRSDRGDVSSAGTVQYSGWGCTGSDSNQSNSKPVEDDWDCWDKPHTKTAPTTNATLSAAVDDWDTEPVNTTLVPGSVQTWGDESKRSGIPVESSRWGAVVSDPADDWDDVQPAEKSQLLWKVSGNKPELSMIAKPFTKSDEWGEEQQDTKTLIAYAAKHHDTSATSSERTNDWIEPESKVNDFVKGEANKNASDAISPATAADEWNESTSISNKQPPCEVNPPGIQIQTAPDRATFPTRVPYAAPYNDKPDIHDRSSQLQCLHHNVSEHDPRIRRSTSRESTKAELDSTKSTEKLAWSLNLIAGVKTTSVGGYDDFTQPENVVDGDGEIPMSIPEIPLERNPADNGCGDPRGKSVPPVNIAGEDNSIATAVASTATLEKENAGNVEGE